MRFTLVLAIRKKKNEILYCCKLYVHITYLVLCIFQYWTVL